MRNATLIAILAAICPGLTRAEEAGAESVPLVLNVRPSGFEASAQDRRERLIRRARDLEFAFRSICTGCGASGITAPQVGTTFSPSETLAARRAGLERGSTPAETSEAGQ